MGASLHCPHHPWAGTRGLTAPHHPPHIPHLHPTGRGGGREQAQTAVARLIRKSGDLRGSRNQISRSQRGWVLFTVCVLPLARTGLHPLCRRETLCRAAHQEHCRDGRSQGGWKAAGLMRRIIICPLGCLRVEKKWSRRWPGRGCLNTHGGSAQSPMVSAVAPTKCQDTILSCPWEPKNRAQVKRKLLCLNPTRLPHKPSWLGSYKAFFIRSEGLFKA